LSNGVIHDQAVTEITDAWRKVTVSGTTPKESFPNVKDFADDLSKDRDNILKEISNKKQNYSKIALTAATEANKRALAASMIHCQYELSRTAKLRAAINIAKGIITDNGLLDILINSNE